jgi:two-component system sensor histidine kinase MprB
VSLRGRLTVMSAFIVGTILATGALICFLVMRGELRSQIDDSLRTQAAIVQSPRFVRRAASETLPERLPVPPRRAGAVTPYTQFVGRDGRVRRPRRDELRLPVTAADRAVARGDRAQVLNDRHAEGVHVRVITVPIKGLGAVQFGRSLESVDSAVARLRLVLLVLVGGGTALALVASRLFSRSAIAPIRQLTDATSHIEATGDLGRRVDTERKDEVGRLAHSFNAMLDRLQTAQVALESSTAAQRQLVADASHELRTPVASLRTNVEVLLASDHIGGEDRDALLHDVVEQTEELSNVVSDLIELARGDQPPDHTEELDLGAIAGEALTRARRHAPGLEFRGEIAPWPMQGSPERLGRAVNNLLDNAAKFSPPGSVVELVAADGVLSVRDHGPGVPADELPQIFDRFFRARGTGQVNGSGLGLAIVRQAVEAHGGAVEASAAAGGGLLVKMLFSPGAAEVGSLDGGTRGFRSRRTHSESPATEETPERGRRNGEESPAPGLLEST